MLWKLCAFVEEAKPPRMPLTEDKKRTPVVAKAPVNQTGDFKQPKPALAKNTEQQQERSNGNMR